MSEEGGEERRGREEEGEEEGIRPSAVGRRRALSLAISLPIELLFFFPPLSLNARRGAFSLPLSWTA